MAALNGRLGGCRLADLQMDGVVACAPFVHPPVIRFTSPGHMTRGNFFSCFIPHVSYNLWMSYDLLASCIGARSVLVNIG
jgi:hypothetical protein